MNSSGYIGWRQVQSNIEASKAQALAAIADRSKVGHLGPTALAIYQHQIATQLKKD